MRIHEALEWKKKMKDLFEGVFIQAPREYSNGCGKTYKMVYVAREAKEDEPEIEGHDVTEVEIVKT